MRLLRNCLAVVGVLFVLVIVVVAVESHGPLKKAEHPRHHAAASPTASVSASSSPSAALSPSPTPETLLTLSGSGDTTTAPFQAPKTWRLVWSYNCSAYGYAGNFIVSMYHGTSEDYADPGLNQLGTSGSGTDYNYSGGLLNLQIESECNWTVTALGGG